ncbi:E2.6.1.42 [Lepeophtheirus salmonis]|uniref:Branched-chain-amino-acid aminotransferase n=1 Tax=Lepeophtheirus salmonis TaxID=72036 RepID=A0A7R8CGG7_LEPSM|nr:E2.6.1.42 [Lepeophtheirus salmonis]CAF2815805.1 E2.6.1.42 [Lepeophtheirus salmonis]
MSRSYVSGLESSKLQIVTCCPSQLKRWTSPLIKPLENLSIHPGSKVLHYAQEIFEGLKAFRGIDDKIRLFRPLHNMERMNLSAKRSKLPNFHGSSLYIRPTLIGTEPALGVNPSNEAKLYVLLYHILVDAVLLKMGCNYAPTLWTQSIASSHNCAQNLWLFGEDHEITEVGAMNIFIYLINRKTGLKELVTPSLEKGLILPGVVRRSIIELSQEIFKNEFVMSEKSINMNELLEALKEERLIEIFGAGTAATICPIKGIHYDGVMHKIPFENPEKVSNRIRSKLEDIFYGKINHSWAVEIESWNLEKQESIRDFDLAHQLMFLKEVRPFARLERREGKVNTRETDPGSREKDSYSEYCQILRYDYYRN